ncbi:MAG: hypothetical protein J5I93_09945 [Pirellulaceae bacterium]|nr:hypothetical protein [Pirellulaceae bacterium]
MGGNGLIFQIVGVLLILFFLFLTYMCTKTWKIVHVLLLFMVFGASIASAIYASMALKTQKAWRSAHERLEAQLEAAKREGEQLLLGDMAVVRDWRTSDTDAFLTARGELNRYLMDGGRIWRNCTKTGVNGLTVTLNTVPPNTPPDEERPNRIVDRMVLYAFLEATNPDGILVPVYYLGEFQATAVTDSSVTIQPLRPLTPAAEQAVTQSNATWSLYEMMPLDSHLVFADTASDDEHLFGEIDEQKLRGQWLPNPTPPLPNYDLLIAELLKDGTLATPEDEARVPERIWYKVKFLKNHEIEVDSGDVQGVLNTSYFDRNGRAIVQRLRRGDPDSPEPAKFEIDAIAVFDKATADGLVAQGIVEKLSTIYVRKLIDFEFEYHQLFSRSQSLDELIRNVKRDTAEVVKADEQTNEQIRFRQGEKAKLEADLVKFNLERDVITQYAGQLDQQWETMRQSLSTMYNMNLAMAAELSRISAQMTEEIDQRTAAATP